MKVQATIKKSTDLPTACCRKPIRDMSQREIETEIDRLLGLGNEITTAQAERLSELRGAASAIRRAQRWV